MYCKKINKECNLLKYCNSRNEKKDYAFFSNFKKVDIEEFLFEIGIKDVILYQYINIKEVHDFIKRINLKRKHIVGIYSVIELESFSERRLKNGFVNIVVAKDKRILRSFINYDTSSDYKLRNIGTGKLLGYPNCCIKYIVENSNSIQKIKKIERKKYKSKCPLLGNKIKLYTHIPCSNMCKETISISEKLLLSLSIKNGENIINDFFY